MNLVNELQVSATNDDVLTVLRKTMRCASKLNRTDILDWLKWEEGGYPVEQALPDYRKVRATLAYNTNGYVPVGYGQIQNGIIEVSKYGVVGSIPVDEPISTVIATIHNIDKGNEVYRIVDGELDTIFRGMVHLHPRIADQVSFLLHASPLELKSIPERVKTYVLNWACALERSGVLGDSMTFSTKEINDAKNVSFNISYCTIEQMTNSGINRK